MSPQRTFQTSQSSRLNLTGIHLMVSNIINYNKCILTDDSMKMAELVLKNKYFEFSSTIKHKISETAIGTKCTLLYACIFMDYIETEFLKSEYIQPWIWARYIGVYSWTAS